MKKGVDKANGRQTHATNEAKRTKKASKTRQEASNELTQEQIVRQLRVNRENGVDQAVPDRGKQAASRATQESYAVQPTRTIKAASAADSPPESDEPAS